MVRLQQTFRVWPSSVAKWASYTISVKTLESCEPRKMKSKRGACIHILYIYEVCTTLHVYYVVFTSFVSVLSISLL